MAAELADPTAAALVETWHTLMAVHPDAWLELRDGVLVCATGIPSPGFNGVWCSRLDPNPAELRRLLRELHARGLPHMLQLRPGSDAAAVAVAEEERLTPSDEMPLMRLDDPSALDGAAAASPQLAIRRVSAEDGDLHARTAAPAFGEPPDYFVRLLPAAVMAAAGVRAYVGELGGEVVATALGATHHDSVAVFNVGTAGEHRRRGYGAAITARVVIDGLAAGASWAWLQSSPSGQRVYEALGFRTLERWLCWVRT